MIYTEEFFSCACNYPLEQLGTPEKLLFFDIETTGLSAHSSVLYLIGCVSFDGKRWKLVQWMAERFLEESLVLHTFLDYCRNFDTLVHFNGDAFDIPYLTSCGNQYGISVPFDQMNSIDLMRLIRPLRKLLSLDNLKLKTIECRLGIAREDRYTGGELIKVYESYVAHPTPEASHLLLLHNAEDLKNLPPLLSILLYRNLADRIELVTSCTVADNQLTLECSARCFFPADITISQPHFSCQLHADHLHFRIPLLTGRLRYFYPDYRNYFYLPMENYAVHKKVGQFVDSKHRIQATASTAYTWKEDTFLPLPPAKRPPRELQLGEETLPVLRPSFESTECYLSFRPEQDFLTRYAAYLLSQIQ